MTSRTLNRSHPVASIIVPAYNEERALGRLLDELTKAPSREFDIIVACNGCTDGTISVARRYAEHVRVVELTEPSKPRALRAGDSVTTVFPRLYVDADVVIDAPSARLLVHALRSPSIHLVAPERRFDFNGSGRAVRAYYDVWQRLPAVRNSTYGRGVIAVDAEGHRRVSRLPNLLADDLYANNAFTPSERWIVPEATAHIRAPRRFRDLIRRRIRTSEGNSQQLAAETIGGSTRTSLRNVIDVFVGTPRLAPGVVVFLVVTVWARLAARRRARAGRVEWLRDESSR